MSMQSLESCVSQAFLPDVDYASRLSITTKCNGVIILHNSRVILHLYFTLISITCTLFLNNCPYIYASLHYH